MSNNYRMEINSCDNLSNVEIQAVMTLVLALLLISL